MKSIKISYVLSLLVLMNNANGASFQKSNNITRKHMAPQQNITSAQTSEVPPMSKIPKIIWQTYKTKQLPKPAQGAQKTWTNRNQGYAYHLCDDADIDKYIRTKWNEDTYAFFKELPLGVMKADLWRYLIIATEGGIYSDIDSTCCTPISKWGHLIPKNSPHVMLLGLENDKFFCQWTITATPKHPAMNHICTFIVEKWKEKGINPAKNFVCATTGPGIWSEAIKDYLGEERKTTAESIYNLYIKDANYRKKINDLGIWLFPQSFYAGIASKNLYGSQNFGDGYVQWTEESDKLWKKNSL